LRPTAPEVLLDIAISVPLIDQTSGGFVAITQR